MKKMLVTMALGAALAWLFDPDNGSRRRDSVKAKLDKSGTGGARPPASAVRPTVADVGSGAAPTVASIP